MDHTNIDVAEDVDKGHAHQENKHLEHTDCRLFIEAAGLLTLWSILVINEGGIRLIDSDPSVELLADGRPPKLVVFLGGLFEVAFGLFGLFIGVAAFILRWYNTFLTYLAMVVQTILGYYVFIVFVFVIPAFDAADLTEPSPPGLSISQSRFLIALGVLTSFHFCLALQGGQFVFFARLVCGGTGRNFLMQKTGNRMRAFFWNGNLAFSGLWTFITGVLINVEVGSGRLDVVFNSPPNVGTLPGFTIWNGLLMMAWGLVGIVLVALRTPVPKGYYVFSGVVYLFAFLNFTIVQLGLVEVAPSGALALHAGLVFMTVFLGPYFVNLAAKEDEET